MCSVFHRRYPQSTPLLQLPSFVYIAPSSCSVMSYAGHESGREALSFNQSFRTRLRSSPSRDNPEQSQIHRPSRLASYCPMCVSLARARLHGIIE